MLKKCEIIDVVEQRWQEWCYNNMFDKLLDSILKYEFSCFTRDKMLLNGVAPGFEEVDIFINNSTFIEMSIFSILCLDFKLYQEKQEDVRDVIIPNLTEALARLVCELKLGEIDVVIELINDRLQYYGECIRNNNTNNSWTILVVDEMLNMVVREYSLNRIIGSREVLALYYVHPLARVHAETLIANWFANDMKNIFRVCERFIEELK